MEGQGWRRKRKAVSPVLATVILIAITLIAAVAIAGFVFGLFGGFTSSAQVYITAASCRATSSGGSCSITLVNRGTSNTTVVGGTITYAGTSVPLTCTPPLTVGAISQPTTIQCSFSPTGPTGTSAPAPQQGQSFVISISLANGGQPQYSGQFSA